MLKIVDLDFFQTPSRLRGLGVRHLIPPIIDADIGRKASQAEEARDLMQHSGSLGGLLRLRH